MQNLQKGILCALVLVSGVYALRGQYAHDPTFHASVGGGQVYRAISTKDGKHMLLGDFKSIAGVPRNRIARLHANGELDLTFDPGQGPNDAVYSIAEIPDGGYMVAGTFNFFNGADWPTMVKLRPDGSFDPSFKKVDYNRPFGPHRVRVDQLGRPMLACLLTIAGINRPFVRFNAGGGKDDSFEFSPVVQSVADFDLNKDGSLILGGRMKTPDGVVRPLAKFKASGEHDPSFAAPPLDNGDIETLNIAADGKILVTGTFTSIDGYSRKRIARFNASGSVDVSFSVPDASFALDLLPLNKGNWALMFDGGTISALNENGGQIFKLSPGQAISAAWSNSAGEMFYALPTIVKKLTSGAAIPAKLTGFQVYAVELNGTLGANYRLEWSNDASPDAWLMLTNLTLSAPQQYFFDLASTNGGKRFYRAIGPQ